MGCIEAISSVLISLMMMVSSMAWQQNYGDALYKSILFFEGQRSGKLPSNQRMKWRSHSALRDGRDCGDEQVWAAAWLYKASGTAFYANYVKRNVYRLAVAGVLRNIDGKPVSNGGTFTEFGWDAKHAGIVVLLSQLGEPFVSHADGFVCSVLPESPTKTASYSHGDFLLASRAYVQARRRQFANATALGFLLLAYADYMRSVGRVVRCGNNVAATADRLASVARSQVDYILGNNPLGMSYMVGYGRKFPQKIHHRGSVLPNIFQHPQRIDCRGGAPYFESNAPNANILTGAVVGESYRSDCFNDSRYDAGHTEPTTYINTPLVGMLAYFK